MTTTVLTYHHRGAEMPREDYRIFSLWEHSWRSAGWTPLLLDASAAELHPRYEDLRRHALFLPTVNPVIYELSCYLRWLAYASIVEAGGPMLVSDFDVVNRGYTPDDWALDAGSLPRGWPFTLLCEDMTPALACVSTGGVETLLSWFLSATVADYESHDGRPHCSDQVVIGRRWPKWAQLVDAVRPRICAEARTWDGDASLVHCSTGAAAQLRTPKFNLMLRTLLYP